MSCMTSAKVEDFRRIVWEHYKKNGRHDLPWRKTKDPYKILVSEVMLQQTQVPRVIEKYKKFLEAFPNVRSLARAPLGMVLKVWSGLGYNRRGKYVHDAAKEIVRAHKGKVPRDLAVLRTLSGMGPYTASAVRVFAFNEPDVLIETNVRTALIHHFFPISGDTISRYSDSEVLPIAKMAAKGQDPRKWHSALFDYGSYLKRNGIKINSRTRVYTKQSKFKGSLREVRGAILKAAHMGQDPESLPFSKRRIGAALVSLKRDGLI